MSDPDWLTEVFERAARSYRELPVRARPILARPLTSSRTDSQVVEPSADSLVQSED
jgi:hypothetical protein